MHYTLPEKTLSKLKMIDPVLQLKDLAVATRTRKLSDRLMQEGNTIYRALNIDFEARWFTMFYLLSYSEKPMSILDIASALGVTHPAINQMAQEMLDKDLIYASADSCDKRKRLLALSEKGKKLLPVLEIIWKHKIASIKCVLNSAGFTFLECLNRIEAALDEKTHYERFLEFVSKDEKDKLALSILLRELEV